MPKIEEIRSEHTRNKLIPYRHLLEPNEIPVQRIYDFLIADGASMDTPSTNGKAICYALMNVASKLDKVIELLGGEKAASTAPQKPETTKSPEADIKTDAGSTPAASTKEPTAEERILSFLNLSRGALTKVIVKALEGNNSENTVRLTINKMTKKGIIKAEKVGKETRYKIAPKEALPSEKEVMIHKMK